MSIRDNQASVAGGGVFNAGLMQAFTATIKQNTAPAGAGVYQTGSSSAAYVLSGSAIDSNKASSDGAGMLNDGGFLSLNGQVAGNAAGRFGGGVLNGGDGYYPGTVQVAAGAVTANTASGDGGGIYNAGTVRVSSGGSISGNVPDDCVNITRGSGC